MVFSPHVLDVLQNVKGDSWNGSVYRHMFAGFPPSLQNTRGARWNPQDVAAIYTSLERETALAEANYRLDLEPLRPKAKRTIYTIRIALRSLVELSGTVLENQLRIDSAVLSGRDLALCQEVGGAVAWLGHDGLVVPSARRRPGGRNLVIFPRELDPDNEFEVLESEVIAD